MALISLGTINKKIFFAVIAGIFELIANIFLYKEVDFDSHPGIAGINAGLGLSLSFFPFLYLKLRDRKKKHLKQSNLLPKAYNSLSPNNEITKKIKKKYLYFLAIASLDFSQKFFSFYFQGLFLDNFWIFDTCLLSIFSFLILKNKFYKHHFISLIIMSIIGIISIIINRYDKGVTFWQVLVTLIIETFYSLENVICKYAMETKFSSPYEICLFIGLFDLILFSILLIIFTNVQVSNIEKMNHFNDNHIDDFYSYVDELDIKTVFLIILLMFVRCVYILFGFITVEHFTPAHIVLIIIIGESFFIFVDHYNWKIYIKIVCYIFLFFFLLIFTEIIELNIFGLQNNTSKNIRKRSDLELINNEFLLNDVKSNSSESRKESFDENNRITLLSENGNEYYL